MMMPSTGGNAGSPLVIATAAMPAVYAIVCADETGVATPKYDAVTILSDHAGLSVGFFQATDGSGSLDAMCLEYLKRGGLSAPALRALIDLVVDDATRQHTSLPEARRANPRIGLLADLLVKLGFDSLWQEIQADTFAANYVQPALTRWAEGMFRTPLALAMMADVANQSGPSRIDKLRLSFTAKSPLHGGDERTWCREFNAARRAFLAKLGGAGAASTYRCTTFDRLMDADEWDLVPPLPVLARSTITEEQLKVWDNVLSTLTHQWAV